MALGFTGLDGIWLAVFGLSSLGGIDLVVLDSCYCIGIKVYGMSKEMSKRV